MMMTRMPRFWSRAATAAWALAAVLFLVKWGDAAPVEVPEFETVEAMVAMRDGVKLHTLVFSPKGAPDALPILFMRTPYGIDGRTAMFQTSLKELADDGYVFAFQDIRGKFRSEGEFAMIRAPRDRADPKAIDEGTDAYDTIDWLIKNVRGHNGRVGMLGVSYDGWLTVMALLEPHPALKAASPQASPADMFLGDDFHHNGAFRLSYGFEYVAQMESDRGIQFFQFDRHDTYEWFLALGPLSSANARYFHEKLPTWNDFVHHPNYDQFWQQAGRRADPDPAQGPDAQRRRLVGPGGLLRPAQDLRDVGEAGYRPPEHPGRRDRGIMAVGATGPVTTSGRSSSMRLRPGSIVRRSSARSSPTTSRTGRSHSRRSSAVVRPRKRLAPPFVASSQKC